MDDFFKVFLENFPKKSVEGFLDLIQKFFLKESMEQFQVQSKEGLVNEFLSFKFKDKF